LNPWRTFSRVVVLAVNVIDTLERTAEERRD